MITQKENLLEPLVVEKKDSLEFDDIMSFKCRSTDKALFQRLAGRSGSEYLRQAMNHISAQLEAEQALAEKAAS